MNSGYPLDRAIGRAGQLRPISWSELAAQLDAARELRPAFTARKREGVASFHPELARHIARIRNGKRGINLDGLGNCKLEVAIRRSSTQCAARDGRESK